MHGTKRPVQCSPLVIPLRVIPLHLCVAAEAGRLGRGSHGCGSGLRMHPRTAQAESARAGGWCAAVCMLVGNGEGVRAWFNINKSLCIISVAGTDVGCLGELMWMTRAAWPVLTPRNNLGEAHYWALHFLTHLKAGQAASGPGLGIKSSGQ